MKTRLAILLWATSPSQPHRCSAPFFHAAAAAAMDVEVEIYFTGDSVNLLRRGVAQSLPSGPSGRETVHHFMAEAVAHGARFFACSEALQERGLTAQDLVDEVCAIGGAAAFVGRALDEEWTTLTY